VTLLAIGLSLVLASFFLGLGLCALTRVVSPRFGFVDKPGGRKAHRKPTPLGGGVAIWLTVMILLGLGALALGPGQSLLPDAIARHAPGAWARSGPLALMVGLATLIMFMGLADDRVGLGWKLRFGVQVGLATILVASGTRVTLFWPLSNVWISGAITVLWIVGLTNAFNFLDNMDGLAAGVGLIAAGLFAAAQLEVEDLFVPAVLLILVGALGGFLVHNSSPARLFMGDAGSNFLGFFLGALTVAGTFARPEQGYSRYGVLIPLLVMAVPLYDTTSVIWIRIREGRSPFEADRRHFSHRLVERGLTPPLAVRTIYLVTLAGGLGALLLPRIQGAAGACVVVAQTLCLLGVVALLEVSSNRPERRDGEAIPPTAPGLEARSETAADGRAAAHS
jgi:UDP-GlcNAc:undecaprenyl-phosphate GlcNAc-1-phosphate transferase